MYTVNVTGMSLITTLTSVGYGACGSLTPIGLGITGNGSLSFAAPITGVIYVWTTPAASDSGFLQVTSP